MQRKLGSKMNYDKMSKKELVTLLIHTRNALINCDDSRETVLYLAEKHNVDMTKLGLTNNEYED